MASDAQTQPYKRARKAYSQLQRERLSADCSNYLPNVLKGLPHATEKEAVPVSAKFAETIKGLFPHTCTEPLVEFNATGGQPEKRDKVKVGVVLLGGQAPAGENYIAGIFDGIRRWNAEC